MSKRLILKDNRGDTFVLTGAYIFGWVTVQGHTMSKFPSVNQVTVSDLVSIELVEDAPEQPSERPGGEPNTLARGTLPTTQPRERA